MDISSKPVEEVTVADLSRYPVWEYILDQEELGETQVRPVTELPVNTLGNRVIGTRIHLHNGSKRWAVLSNVSLRNPRRTNYFLFISVEKDGQWFHLARYFDAEYQIAGPTQLAAFLGLPVGEVFPITYDLTGVAVGSDAVIKGTIPIEPPEKLTEDEIRKMCLESEDE